MLQMTLSESSLFKDNPVKLRDKFLAEEITFHILVYCDDCQLPAHDSRFTGLVTELCQYLLDHLMTQDKKEMNVSITLVKH
jgi:hypothetical protein